MGAMAEIINWNCDISHRQSRQKRRRIHKAHLPGHGGPDRLGADEELVLNAELRGEVVEGRFGWARAGWPGRRAWHRAAGDRGNKAGPGRLSRGARNRSRLVGPRAGRCKRARLRYRLIWKKVMTFYQMAGRKSARKSAGNQASSPASHAAARTTSTPSCWVSRRRFRMRM